MTLIILVLIFGVLFFSRNKLKNLVIKIINKYKKTEITEINTDLVYTPILSSRTFTFNIQIDEVGNGRAKITVIK